VDITLANEQISTGYGVGWRNGHSHDSIFDICDKVGFLRIKSGGDGEKFLLRAWKMEQDEGYQLWS